MKREARRLTILCDLFNDCDRWGTLQFWFAFTSKLHFMIIKLKNSSELVAIGRNCLKKSGSSAS